MHKVMVAKDYENNHVTFCEVIEENKITVLIRHSVSYSAVVWYLNKIKYHSVETK